MNPGEKGEDIAQFDVRGLCARPRRGRLDRAKIAEYPRTGRGHATQFLRDQLQLLERGYREHGDIFRLRLGRRPAVVMVGPELARWVFKHTDDRTLSIGPSLAFTLRLFGPDFYFLAPPEEYQHQRETLLPLGHR